MPSTRASRTRNMLRRTVPPAELAARLLADARLPDNEGRVARHASDSRVEGIRRVHSSGEATRASSGLDLQRNPSIMTLMAPPLDREILADGGEIVVPANARDSSCVRVIAHG